MSTIDKLISGYQAFYKRYFQGAVDPLFKRLSRKQSPDVLVISCSDSRVDPAILTGARAGDIFSIRNVANLVPPYEPDPNSHHGTSAAIEYAVNHLHVKHIIVMGHSKCGGIQALVESDLKEHSFSFIADWIKIALPAKKRIPAHFSHSEACTFCEKEAIKTSLTNLMSFPWIKEKVEQKSLKLHGWYFCVETGELSALNSKTNQFESTQ